MLIYWYWPFVRPEELPLACSTARADDQVIVHAIARDGAPATSPCPQVLVRRDLPDARRGIAVSPRWLVSRGLTYIERARRRHEAIASIDPTIVHLHYLNRFTDWRAPRRLRCPLVVSVHDVIPHQTRLPPSGERALLWLTYRRADAVIVHHELLRQRLLVDFGLEERRVFVLPHQVFAYGTGEPAPLPERDSILLFGSLRSNKGVDVFLEAVAESTLDVKFRIAGRGDSRLEDRVRRAAAEDPRLEVEVGYIPQQRKIELFREASLVVLPYTSFSSQSGVLHDAYAHGRPVVVTDVGALGESVREDDTGEVIPPNDARALKAAMAHLLQDREALAHYAECAETVRRERSPERLGPQLRRIYDEVLGP